MRLSDRLTGLLLILFGLAVILHARTFPLSPGQDIGPGLFPMLMGSGLAVAGAVMLWTALRQSPGPWLAFEAWVRRPRMVLNAAGVMGVLVAYALLVDVMGFFITAFLLLTTLFLLFGVPRRWIPIVAGAVTLAMHGAFYSLLRVPLPWGWLERFAW